MFRRTEQNYHICIKLKEAFKPNSFLTCSGKVSGKKEVYLANMT
jgi:hypothetical protein